jgi:hypothetical protein
MIRSDNVDMGVRSGSSCVRRATVAERPIPVSDRPTPIPDPILRHRLEDVV